MSPLVVSLFLFKYDLDYADRDDEEQDIFLYIYYVFFYYKLHISSISISNNKSSYIYLIYYCNYYYNIITVLCFAPFDDDDFFLTAAIFFFTIHNPSQYLNLCWRDDLGLGYPNGQVKVKLHTHSIIIHVYRRSTEDINTVLVRVVVYNNIATAAAVFSIFLPPVHHKP